MTTCAAAAVASAAAAIADLRRPASTNVSDFFYVRQEQWDQWIAEAASDNKRAKKSAQNSLRKYNAAGRIMETSEGKGAVAPCSWCIRPGLTVPCMVYADKEDRACAYCKVKGKAGCTAAVVKLPTQEERILALESEVALLREMIESRSERRDVIRRACEVILKSMGDEEEEEDD